MKRTHQEQTREVGAANYEDRASDGQKKKEDRTRTVEPFSERGNPNLQARIEAGKVSCQPSGDCLHVSTSLFNADPCPKPGIDRGGLVLTIQQLLRRDKER